MLKVLIIGLGSIAKKHIKVLFDLDTAVKIYALRSSRESLSVSGVTDIYEMSESPNDLSFIIISNPTSEHYRTIEAALALKVPLFIEKPVLSTLFDSKMLEDKVHKSDVLTYVACNLRFHPCITVLKKEFESRRPVEMNVYAGSFLPDWRPEVDYRKVYSSSAEMGGGVHLDLIHEIDYTVFLMEMPKTAAFYGGKKSSLEISSYDVAHYALEYENSSVFITLNYYRRTAKRHIEVIWNDEEWTIDLLSNTIISSTQGIVLDEKFDLRETYKYQMQYFLSAIQNEEKAMNDFSESLEILGLCLNQKENAKG